MEEDNSKIEIVIGRRYSMDPIARFLPSVLQKSEAPMVVDITETGTFKGETHYKVKRGYYSDWIPESELRKKNIRPYQPPVVTSQRHARK